MTKGDSVRLILNREFLTPEYKKKLVASDVTYSSVGIFGGKIIEYSGTETDVQGVSDVYVSIVFFLVPSCTSNFGHTCYNVGINFDYVMELTIIKKFKKEVTQKLTVLYLQIF